MYVRNEQFAWELAPGGRPVSGGAARSSPNDLLHGPPAPPVHATMALTDPVRGGNSGTFGPPTPASSSLPRDGRGDVALDATVSHTDIITAPAPIPSQRPLLPVITL